ncbi:MAG: type II toxin-antitoxin system RelE/ParE family toxin [Alphaproteobacteria bacterium]|nr:type II toxin-antitoxin system RelE/ParE family toxin [Alphaproteobacteria bacterium]
MWKVIYHKEVEYDLELLGSVEARQILKAINERVIKGDPDKIGKPLSGDLAGCRRIRVGNTRIIYRINKKEVEVFIIAVGIRRDDIVYKMAKKRF